MHNEIDQIGHTQAGNRICRTFLLVTEEWVRKNPRWYLNQRTRRKEVPSVELRKWEGTGPWKLIQSKKLLVCGKVHLVKAIVFPVVMYGCESWTIKKAERQKIDAFELWCWRRHLRVPWTARQSNQSILKEISPECSLEGLMLKLKLQYFGHLMQSWLFWKDPDAGKDWGQEDKGKTEDEMVGWHHQLNGHEFGWTPGVGDGQGGLACWVHEVAKSWTRLNCTRTPN